MLMILLYLIQKLLIVVLALASGTGFFLIANVVVFLVWGERYLTGPAEMVFFLGGLLLSAGLLKLVDILEDAQIDLYVKKKKAEAALPEESRALIEHLKVI